MGIKSVPNKNAVQKTLDSTFAVGASTCVLNEDVSSLFPSVSATNPGVGVVDRIDSSNNATPSKREFFTFTGVSTATLTGVTKNADGSGSDQEHAVGAIVEFVPDVLWAQSIQDIFETEHNADGTHAAITADVIAEQTGGAGVTLDGVLLKDGVERGEKAVVIQVEDGATSLATGDGKAYFVVPSQLNGMNLVRVHARVITAPTGATLSVMIHNLTDTSDMLSTALTIDAGETGSNTAATAAVIDTGEDDVVTYDCIRIDIDQVGSTVAGKGLIITLEFDTP